MRKRFILHQDNDPKLKTPCQGIYKGNEMESLTLPKSISRFKSDWTWISPAEGESKGRNSPKQASIGIGWIKGRESILKDETKSLVMSIGHRLTADCAQRINNSF